MKTFSRRSIMVKRTGVSLIALALILSCIDDTASPTGETGDAAFSFEFTWYIGDELIGVDQVSADSIRFTISSESIDTQVFAFDFNKRVGAMTGIPRGIDATVLVEVFNANGETFFAGQTREQITTEQKTIAVIALHALPPIAPAITHIEILSPPVLSLQWQDNSSWETGYIIERSTGDASGFDSMITVAANTTSWADSAIAPGIRYYYRICAFNRAGKSTYSAVDSAAIPASPVSAPSNLHASAVSDNQITLTWTDNAADAARFIVERKNAANAQFDSIAGLPVATLTYTDIGLSPSTPYEYRVRAVAEAGASPWSAVLSVTTSAPAAVQTVIARDDAFAATEDDTLIITAQDVWANDTFSLAYAAVETLIAVVDQPQNGILISGQSQWEYVPATDWAGADSFTYAITVDDSISSNVARVRIAVSEVNDHPRAGKDEYSVKQDSDLVVDAAAGVLGNDYDADDQNLTIGLLDSTHHGALSLYANGGFAYTPAAGFAGADSFSYVVRDNDEARDSAWVIIAVTPKDNTSPVAVADSFTVAEDAGLTVGAASGVLYNDEDADGDAISAVLVTDVVNGVLELANDGSFSYTPTADFFGGDSFSYKARDAQGGLSAESRASITILSVNDSATFTSEPPAEALEDAAYSYRISATDTEDAGGDLRFAITGKPAWATFTDNSDGTATLAGEPLEEHIGDYPVIIKVWDTNKDTVSQQFTITVRNVNDAPAFTSEPVTAVNEDAVYGYAIAVSDEDAGQTLDISVTSALPAWLQFADNGNGTATLEGTPGNNDVGSYPIELTAEDDSGSTAMQTFTLRVNNVNDAPTINESNLSYTVNEGEVLEFSLSVSDPDGDAVIWSLSPANLGATIGSSSGTFNWQPSYAQAGNYTFAITADDQQGGSDVIEMPVTVEHTPQQFAVVLGAGPGGTLSPSGTVLAEEGSSLSVIADPDDWFRVSGWQIDVDYTTINSHSVQINNIQSDMEIYASFARNWDQAFQINIHDNLCFAAPSGNCFIYTSNNSTVGRAKLVNNVWSLSADWHQTSLSEPIIHLACGSNKFIVGSQSPIFTIWEGLNTIAPESPQTIDGDFYEGMRYMQLEDVDMTLTDKWAALIRSFLDFYDYTEFSYFFHSSAIADFQMTSTDDGALGSNESVISISLTRSGKTFGITKAGIVFRVGEYPGSWAPDSSIFSFNEEVALEDYEQFQQIESDNDSSNVLYIISKNGSVYKSTTANANNASFYLLNELNISASKIQMLDANTGWILDNAGKVHFSTQGWTSSSNYQEPLTDIVDIELATNEKAMYALEGNGNVHVLHK